ncbi:MAG TPA: 3-hydroxyacyl-CoA dehydrogenase family protein [Longimicrobiales bacterium]|nr:3-hydroxyacyl-CoA dehydrogenase family protein [Longimicrobiales bacterium]
MSERIDRVAVLGAGTMGHGIAQVAAQAGFEVVLADASEEALERGLESIRRNLDEGVARGKVTDEQRAETLARLSTARSVGDAVRGADLVVEAVPERFDLKVQVFEEVEADAPPEAILATNTSSLSVTDLQSALGRPERVVGLHFFNPVHIMKLVEVVRGKRSDERVVAAAVAFARRLGKDPIVVNDAPGFASSRLGVALGLEAMRMLEEGVASAEDIDKAMELGYRHPMGPLKLTDLVGLDVRLSIAEYLHERLGAEQFRPPAILRRLVTEGKLGKKSGQGFYNWE